jgi:hypothetical protein
MRRRIIANQALSDSIRPAETAEPGRESSDRGRRFGISFRQSLTCVIAPLSGKQLLLD